MLAHRAELLLRERLRHREIVGGKAAVRLDVKGPEHLEVREQREPIDGARVEAVLEKANIALNKNTIPGDKSALSPGGVRMGAPALTSRGFDEADFETVVDLFDRGVQIALDVKAQGGKLKDFRQKITEGENAAAIEALKKDVSAFASGFPQVGVPDA